jgi:uncharacterized protein (DUF362 family)
MREVIYLRTLGDIRIMTMRQTQPERKEHYRRPDASLVLSRRRFLQGVVSAVTGLLATGCLPKPPMEGPGQTLTLAPTILPTSTPTIAPTIPPSPPSLSKVAIARAENYDRALVRQQVQALLDGLGGLDDVVSSGDRVAIKVNLTSGTHFEPPAGVSATESYLTHPEVVRALGELLRDAGARELFIVEAVYDRESYPLYGYEAMAKALDASLIDLNDPHPYSDFASTPVGEGWFIYESFVLNRILQEVDAFVSVAKMKCHFNCGVTHSMKNLIGLVPASHYRLSEDHWWRSALHGTGNETKTRLPRVILDLNRARPIHLALIDGIKTAEGGEVPRGSFSLVEPGVLIAGKNPVATDAVATAAMGFDPTIEPPAAPFLRGDNYLNLAYELGLGTNRLGEIEVVGASIDDVRYQFEPSLEM